VNALHWSPTRSHVRLAACEAEEQRIQAHFDKHNETCRNEDGCYLAELEHVVTRAIQFCMGDEEKIEVVQLSNFGERAPH
jgi:hypothetical protein